jgi:AraC-like DNA-binding protein
MAQRKVVSTPRLEHHHASGVERFSARWSSHLTQHHAHPEYQLTWSIEGTGRFEYLGGTGRLPAGCMALFHPGEPHAIGDAQRDRPWHIRVLHVPPGWFERAGAPLLQPAPLLIDRALRDALEAVWGAFDVEARGSAREHNADEALASGRGPGPAARRSSAPVSRMQRALAELAAVLAARPGLDSHLRRQRSDLVRRCLARLAANLDRPLSMAELARLERAPPTRIRRAISADTGLSPSAWHLQRRIQFAKHELARGESIVGTAHALGFSDQAHFTRHFTRLVGVSPSRYAAAARKRPA